MDKRQDQGPVDEALVERLKSYCKPGGTIKGTEMIPLHRDTVLEIIAALTKPASIGDVEGLRELSEKATPELFDTKPHRLAQMLRDGAYAQVPRADNIGQVDFEADAAFIVACVNHVRQVLASQKDKSNG